MLKQLTTFAITALAVIVINVPYIEDVDAKGFRSSSSFSSSRSSYRSSPSKSSFSSYKSKASTTSTKSTKTVAAKPKSTTTKTTSSKFGNSKGKKASYTTVSSGKQTRAAKAALTNQRAKFKKQPPKASTTRSKVASTKYSNNKAYSRARSSNQATYMTRRNSYYAGYNTPSYVYMGSPSYGMWDTIFLYSLLNSNNNHSGNFAHNYSNDADYRQWRREADELARDNAELRGQLASMDAQSAKLSGTPVVAGYVPEGVDADIMMSAESLASMKPSMRVCVGSQSGAYFRVVAGIMAPGVNSVNMVAVTTHGTPEILANLANGTCDAGFTQGDGYWNYVEANNTITLPFERVISPYKEAVHLVCNEKGPSKMADLGKNNRVWFPSNSGAAETWKNFTGESEQYGKVNTVLNDTSMKVSSYEEALLKVSGDKNSCAMYVAAPGSTTLMKNIDKGAKAGKMVLVDVQDSNLDDTTDPSGADVYSFKKIDSYKALQRKGGCYGYCSGAVETLFVNADFLVNHTWKEANKAAYDTLAVELLGMTPEIAKAVNQ